MGTTFGTILHDYLEQPWEQARGFLREELDQLRQALTSQWGQIFDSNNTISANAVDGPNTASTVPSYVANTGTHQKPKWDKVDVLSGVKNRLQYVHFVSATTGSVLVGRDSTGAGNFEQISLGPEFEMISTELDSPAATLALYTISGGGSL